MKKTLISLALATALLVPAQGVLAETKDLARGNQGDVMYDVLIARPAAWFYFASGVVQYVPSAAVTWISGKDITHLGEELVNKRYRYAIERPLGQF